MNGYHNYKKTTLKEFKQDFNRFKLAAKAMEKWKTAGGDIKLAVNHIVIIFNVFLNTVAQKLLFLLTPQYLWSELKTILAFINQLPVMIPDLGINTLNIPINVSLLRILDNL